MKAPLLTCALCNRDCWKPKDTTEWYYIAGGNLGTPTFCTIACLEAYVAAGFLEKDNK